MRPYKRHSRRSCLQWLRHDLKFIWFGQLQLPLCLRVLGTFALSMVLILPVAYIAAIPLITLAGMQILLGPEMSPYNVLECVPFSWLLKDEGDKYSHVINQIQETLRIYAMKLTVLLASYDYAQMCRENAFQDIV